MVSTVLRLLEWIVLTGPITEHFSFIVGRRSSSKRRVRSDFCHALLQNGDGLIFDFDDT